MEKNKKFEYRAHGNIALHQFKAIYFFIPKVACSSIRCAISDLLGLVPPHPDNPLRHPGNRDFPFVKKDEISTKYRHYFKFCFVRNPWDRLVSCFFNKIHTDTSLNNKWFRNGVANNFWKYGALFYGGMSFEKYIETVLNIPDEDSDIHIRSQHYFFCDKDGVILADFLGRFENIDEDFFYVCRKIGIKQEIELPHLLKTQHKDYKAYYNRRTREMVSRRYEKDIKLLNYKF
jgi:hypothetical protein